MQPLLGSGVIESEDVTAGYTALEHTADVGLRAWGPDPAAAFVQAALGMFAIMLGVDPATLRAAGKRTHLDIVARGADWDELLVNWLAELLYQFEVSRFIPRRITVAHCAPPRCVAQVEGLCLRSARALRGVGIKAITYHQLDVRVAPERTDVRVFLDI
jgi:SHS2 domain-containing protein